MTPTIDKYALTPAGTTGEDGSCGDNDDVMRDDDDDNDDDDD